MISGSERHESAGEVGGYRTAACQGEQRISGADPLFLPEVFRCFSRSKKGPAGKPSTRAWQRSASQLGTATGATVKTRGALDDLGA